MERARHIAFDPSKLTKATAAAAYGSSSESEAGDADEYLMPSRDPTDNNEFGEFNSHRRKRQRTGRDARESAALGVFGSESEDDVPRWGKRKTLRNKGVNFVVSHSAQEKADSDEDNEEEVDEEENDTDGAFKAGNDEAQDDYDEEDEDSGGVGLGFSGAASSAAQGLGWAPPKERKEPAKSTPLKSFVKRSFDGSTPLGSGFTPSSATQPILQAHIRDGDDETPARPKPSLPSAFSGSGRGGRGGKGKTNSQSFGARMMAKMGYVDGQGLGREGQGRNVIIEANLRPQGIGLGAVKEKTEQERKEEKRQAQLRGEVVHDSDEEEKKKKKAASARRKTLGGDSNTGSGASTPRRQQKPRYLTLDEVKKVAPGLKIPDAFTPILDLTGPGKKMLTSSSGLMTPTNGSVTGSTEGIESRKLVRRAQNDFMAILEEWKSLQERKAYLELQLRQERQELDEFDAGLEVNQAITAACDKLSLDAPPKDQVDVDIQTEVTRKLNRIVQDMKSVNSTVSDDILPQLKDELSAVAVAAIHPAFKDFLSSWDPLEVPKPQFLDDLISISHLLGHPPQQKTHRKLIATPYEVMMYKLWLPKVAGAVREWNPRDTDQLIAVIEAWGPLLPSFVRAQLLEQDVARKLDEAVAKWEPKRKKHHSSSSLPHVWIFPWLQYLPAHHLDPRSATGLVADVKRKFRQLVDAWDFERGVVPGLKQWKAVLRPSRSSDQWRPLVTHHIVPSMARYLRQKFCIDPQDQAPYLGMLTGIFEWSSVVSAAVIGEVIIAEMFPAWHDVLYQWLVSEEANYEEIGQWFLWWKDEVFPENIGALPSVAAEFDKGTGMIERALDLGDRAKTELEPPQKGPALPTEVSVKQHKHNHHRHHHNEQHSTPVRQQEAPAVTFRNMVEDWCQVNDLQFVPERKKVHAEGPLYRITARGDGKGGVLVHFKGDRLYADTRKDGLVEIRADREEDLVVLMEYAQ